MTGSLSQRTELVPGYAISRIVKGGWQLAGGHGSVDREAAIDDMFRYVDSGITTFDCADIYTGVEALIGEFLGRYRRRHGRGAGAEIQILTKLVPDRVALPRLTPEHVEGLVDRSLRRLGVDCLDLVQLAWWDYTVPGHVEAALTLQALQRKGKIRLLGATNFDVAHLRQILEAGVPLVAHQVQYSVVDRRPQHGMTALCREHGVRLLCYGTLLGGFLSERYLAAPEPTPPFETRSLTKYKLIIDELAGANGAWSALQRVLGILKRIADRYAASIGAVAIRYVLDRAGVAAAVVGVRHAGHLTATLDALRVRLDSEDTAAIDGALAGRDGPAGDTFALERVRDGRHATIMRYDLNREAPDPVSES